MTETSPLDRIEAALTRIEAAATTGRCDRDTLARRHAKLRDSMTKAVAALDEIIVREEKR